MVDGMGWVFWPCPAPMTEEIFFTYLTYSLELLFKHTRV